MPVVPVVPVVPVSRVRELIVGGHIRDGLSLTALLWVLAFESP